MDVIIRRRRGQGIKEFKVYSKKEADKLNLNYCYWRDVETGQYCISDDGFVAECLNRSVYINKNGIKNTWILLPYGVIWGNNSRVEYLPRREIRKFHSSKPEHWLNNVKNNARIRKTVRVYADMIFKGRIDWEKLSQVYSHNGEKMTVKEIQHLVKKEKIERMVGEELLRTLEGDGLTKAAAIRALKKAIAIAEAKKDARAMLKASETILKLHGEVGSRKVITGQVEAIWSLRRIAHKESKSTEIYCPTY